MSSSQITIQEESTPELLEDLCIELRHVAVGDSGLPSDPRVLDHIQKVKIIHATLLNRNCDPLSRVNQLSEETTWQMAQLLSDCLRFPGTLPYVREADGIRRTFRCLRCRAAERPGDAKLFWVCDACLDATLDSVRRATPIDGVVLFRTYNPNCRCDHAGSDTVLAADDFQDMIFGVCEICISEEIERRKKRV